MPNTNPVNNQQPKRNYVRGIVIFLAILLFLPPIKQALDVKLVKIESGYFGLWQLFVIISLALLLPALMLDKSDKINLPFLNKFLKDD